MFFELVLCFCMVNLYYTLCSKHQWWSFMSPGGSLYLFLPFFWCYYFFFLSGHGDTCCKPSPLGAEVGRTGYLLIWRKIKGNKKTSGLGRWPWSVPGTHIKTLVPWQTAVVPASSWGRGKWRKENQPEDPWVSEPRVGSTTAWRRDRASSTAENRVVLSPPHSHQGPCTCRFTNKTK